MPMQGKGSSQSVVHVYPGGGNGLHGRWDVLSCRVVFRGLRVDCGIIACVCIRQRVREGRTRGSADRA